MRKLLKVSKEDCVDEIKAIEKVVRSIPIRGDMTYKPVTIYQSILPYKSDLHKNFS